MNPIKTSIDEALETMEVTDELKNERSRRIRHDHIKRNQSSV